MFTSLKTESQFHDDHHADKQRSHFLVNRAAMGRARFLLCTLYINRAAMGRAHFSLCTAFIFRFVGDQTQISTRSYSQWDFQSRNL